MNKQRALEILGQAIISYELLLSKLGHDEETGEQECIKRFEMTEEEYNYVLEYNLEIELQENLSRSLGGAEFISDEEED